MSRRLRLLLPLSLLALAAVAAAVAARHLALQAADQALAAQGLSWQGRHAGLLDASWRDLERPGLHIDRLDARLLPSPHLAAQGVTLRLQDLSLPSPAASAPTPARPVSVPVSVSVSVQDASVWWGDALLAEGLSGPVWPALSLSGPDAAVSWDGGGGAVRARLRRSLSVGPLTADALLTVEGNGDTLEITAEAPEAILAHPTLASGPLPPAALLLRATWTRPDEGLSGEVRLGDLRAGFSGTARLLPSPQVSLAVEAPALALSAVVGLFGGQVPEGRRADLRGTIGLSGTVQGPPWAWSATFEAHDLAVEGAVSGLDRLRYGAVEWMAPSAEGPVLRRSGEGHPHWTPLADAHLMAQAAIAAEDARFMAHTGYDAEGINLALAELAAGEAHPRGGSTLSQQLAKNLFLDGGDRTLARKLRELLLALELERGLGKMRILELYVNIVELGPGIYGVRRAADAYFLKRPHNLSPHEAAFLAAILPAPRSGHDRVTRQGRAPEGAVDRILANMVHTGALDPATAAWAAREPLVFIPSP